MERFKVLLEVRRKRGLRYGLLHFLDALALYLQSGFDLGYSWPETVQFVQGEIPEELGQLLSLPSGQSILSLLEDLSHRYPIQEHRMWFSVLRELYAGGAPLGDAVRAVSRTLRGEHERDLDEHCRRLPARLNILIILFFLPATLMLLFCPLVFEMINAFSH